MAGMGINTCLARVYTRGRSKQGKGDGRLKKSLHWLQLGAKNSQRDLDYAIAYGYYSDDEIEKKRWWASECSRLLAEEEAKQAS